VTGLVLGQAGRGLVLGQAGRGLVLGQAGRGLVLGQAGRGLVLGPKGRCAGSDFGQVFVHLGAAVAEELPNAADLFDHREVEVSDDQLVAILAADRQEIAPGIDKIAGAVELADVPGGLGSDAVDAAHEITVGDGVGGLFEFPQILGQPGDGGRGVVHDLGTGQAERPRALWKMPVVTDVHADGDAGTQAKHGETNVAGFEKEFFPKTGRVRNVNFAVLAQVTAVVVKDCGGVVVHAGHRAFIDGNDHGHAIFLRDGGQALDRGAGDGLGGVVPPPVLRGTKIGAVEDLLETQDLHALLAGLLDERQVFHKHGFLDFGNRATFVVQGIGTLNQTGTHDAAGRSSTACHGFTSKVGDTTDGSGA